jgi:hypothetical protein
MANNNEFIFISAHSQDCYKFLVKDNSIIIFKPKDANNEAMSCQNVIMILYTPLNYNTLKTITMLLKVTEFSE